MKNIEREDLFDVTFLSEVKISPNGKHAAFVETKGSVEENKYFNYIWLYSFETNTSKRLTASGEEKNVEWLNDVGLIFPALRNEKKKEKVKAGYPLTCYYSISIDGGEAAELFDLPMKSSKIKHVGDGKFIVLGAFDNNGADMTKMDDKEKEAYIKELAEQNKAYKIFDEIPFWQNGKGVTNKMRNRLFMYDSHSGSLSTISAPLLNVDSWHVSGDDVLYCGVEFDSMMVQSSQLYTYSISSGKNTKIELGAEYSISFVCLTGTDIIMYARSSDRINSYANGRFYCLSKSGGSVSVCGEGDFSIGSTVASDCRHGGGIERKFEEGALYYISTRRYSSYLFKCVDGVETKLSPGVCGSVDCFDVVDGSCMYVAMRDGGLQELYVLDMVSGEERKVTSFNEKWLNNYNISYPEYFTFNNRDGVELDAFVIKPVGYDSKKKYPAILDIHGGPKVVYGDVLYHEMQHWASKGYFVFFTNPRGSDGRGTEFANINADRWLVWDYNDFMDLTDVVLEKYPQIDKQNVGVTGGSYGGLMTNWIVGHTDRYKAAVTQRSITNYISKCLTTDIGYFHNLDQMGTDPWTDYEMFWDKSPLKYANQVKTPLLFLHSDQDYRCYMADAFQMFTALKMFGVDTRLCLFHGENHELSRSGKPKNRIKRLEEITGWFDKYLV